MNRAYEAAAGTYVRWLFAVPLLVTLLLGIGIIADRASSLVLWFGAAAWGMALGLHWKEYLARPEALLCPAMRRGQIGVGLLLSGFSLVGVAGCGAGWSQESFFAVVSVLLSGCLFGLSVTHFVQLWMSFAGFIPMIGMWVPSGLGKYFFADWMLGESVWPILFAGGTGVCGVVLIVDRYFTMCEESWDYWQPLVTWKGIREYQLQKSKRQGGSEKKQWKLWEWMEERKYRWLMGLPLGAVTARSERRRLRYLGWNFSAVRFGLMVVWMLGCGCAIDWWMYGGRSEMPGGTRQTTLQMMFPMSMIFCLMPMHMLMIWEKFRAGEVMRPISRRRWGRELVEDALLACGGAWSVLTAGMLIVGWFWPEEVFWGGATLLTGLVLAACFLFVNGLLLYLMFAFGRSRRAFNLAFVAIPAAFMPVVIFGQSKMLPTVGTEFLVLMSLGGMGLGLLFIVGAYRRLCAMDIG